MSVSVGPTRLDRQTERERERERERDRQTDRDFCSGWGELLSFPGLRKRMYHPGYLIIKLKGGGWLIIIIKRSNAVIMHF